MTSREGGTAEGRRLRPSPSSGSVGPRNGRPRSPESRGHRGSEPVGAVVPGCPVAEPPPLPSPARGSLRAGGPCLVFWPRGLSARLPSGDRIPVPFRRSVAQAPGPTLG